MAYVVRRRDRWYAVSYEGTDPITGRGRRRWMPADDAGAAHEAARRLSARPGGDRTPRFGITVARYLTTRWLPSRAACLRPTTYFRYQKMVEQYVLPRIGRVPLARLTPRQRERLYHELLARGSW